MTDDDLMTRYLQGDAAAFETLFARHHQAVYGLARRLLTRAEEAEDVMQEAFLRLARGASRYESRGLLRAYLLRIARNLSLDRLHRLERRPFEAAGTGRLTVLDLEGGEPAPPEWLEQRDRLRQLEQHLQGLPWRQREALLLHAQEGLTYREIAVVLEVPLGTVKTLIHRARGRLARALEAHLPEGRDAV